MIHLVISDTHIGDRRTDKNIKLLFSLLEAYAGPDAHLVLNGDIFDLARNLSFDGRHRAFIKIARKFSQVTYVEGNHEWFVSGLGSSLIQHASFCRQYRIERGGRTFNITHGHRTDRVAYGMARFGRFIIRLNKWFEDLTGIDLQHQLRKTWFAKRMLKKQEERLMAMETWGDVLVAGHTHRPELRKFGDRTYINTGDWVESSHCSYLIINDDGEYELKRVS